MNLTYALLPGFPWPEIEGPHYDAEKSYVQAHGLPRPILVDRAGVVWAGRTLANICCDLGFDPEVRVVDDGYAAAVQELATRDLAVLEWADFVLTVYDNPGTNIVLGKAPKRSIAVSLWFQNVMGKTRGFSSSQVEQYVHVARLPSVVREQIVTAKTLGQAMRMLKRMEKGDDPNTASPCDDGPTIEESEAMTAITTCMEALERVNSWTEGGKEILRGLKVVIETTLRRRCCPKD